MLFSILIANFNNGRFFKECYKSILDQHYEYWEVIIVDDASTDNSISDIKELVDDDMRFRLYANDKNLGCGYTKRKCIELAQGEVCGFLDPDDTLLPAALEAMVEAHKKHTDAALVYSRCNRVSEDMGTIYTSEDEIVQVRNGDLYFLNQDGDIGHFTSFKKTYYAKTNSINAYLKRAVDQDLYLKLYEVGKAVFINKVLYNYRFHDRGLSTNRNRNKARYWFWIVMIDAAKRRQIDLEDKFCREYIPVDDCWATRSELQAKPSLFFKKLIRSVKNKIMH